MLLINSEKELEDLLKPRTPQGWYGYASPKGWWKIVAEVHQKLEALYPDYEVFQIKEKFGGLRYYCSVDHMDMAETIIREAEKQAYLTCEECGQPGELRQSIGYWATLCNKHNEERA